eukprot:3023698-Pyramimonas_sp.AAC.1
MQLPSAFLAARRSLYASIAAVGRIVGIIKDVFCILCGVIQGCALSGSLFAAATSAFLEDLRFGLEVWRRGILRACADDVGGVPFDRLDLRYLSRVMKVAEKIANLKLKPPKCLIAPLASATNPEIVASLR